MDEKANRDERLQLFLFGEEDMIPAVSNAATNAMKTYQDANYPNIIVAESEIKDLTGYRIRNVSLTTRNNMFRHRLSLQPVV